MAWGPAAAIMCVMGGLGVSWLVLRNWRRLSPDERERRWRRGESKNFIPSWLFWGTAVTAGIVLILGIAAR